MIAAATAASTASFRRPLLLPPPLMPASLIDVSSPPLGAAKSERPIEDLGQIDRPAVLNAVDEQAPLGVFALAIENLDPSTHIVKVLRLRRDGQDAVEVFHGDQADHARRSGNPAH